MKIYGAVVLDPNTYLVFALLRLYDLEEKNSWQQKKKVLRQIKKETLKGKKREKKEKKRCD